MISLFSVARTISGLFAGLASDRIGYKPVFYISYFLAAPSLCLMLYPSKGVFLFAILGGFFGLAALPLFVTMAQDLAPRGKSMASSLMLGLAYGTGGMMTPLTGKLADIFSIRTVLSAVALLSILMIPLVYLLPDKISKSKS